MRVESGRLLGVSWAVTRTSPGYTSLEEYRFLKHKLGFVLRYASGVNSASRRCVIDRMSNRNRIRPWLNVITHYEIL